MFVVLLKLCGDRSRAKALMAGHNEWIRRGLDEGLLLLVGSLAEGSGGAILVDQCERTELEATLRRDPLIAAAAVSVEVIELTPTESDPRLRFLLDNEAT